MGKPENLKQGEYYGYYDEKGKWITGQNGPNPGSPGQMAMLDAEIARLKNPFSLKSLKAFWKNLMFAIGLSNKN